MSAYFMIHVSFDTNVLRIDAKNWQFDTEYDKSFETAFLCCAVFQKPYENRHRQQRQDSDDGSPKMEQRNNRPNNKQHHNQQNQQQQRGDGGESGGRGGGGGGQYYNNNRNNNQQQNRDMGTSRELPPRFMKKLQQQQVGQVLLTPRYLNFWFQLFKSSFLFCVV